MGKISKYSNLYDKDGSLLRHVNEDGILEKYTTKELEDLLKTFMEDNKIIDQEKYDNVMSILMMRYREAGDNDNIFKRIEEYISTKANSKDEVNDALNDIKEELNNITKEEDEETGKDDSSTEGCVPDAIKWVGGSRRRSRPNETNTTISTAA